MSQSSKDSTSKGLSIVSRQMCAKPFLISVLYVLVTNRRFEHHGIEII